MGNVAENTLLLPLRIDSEAAGGEPKVSVVVKDHGQKILCQLFAERGLSSCLDIDIQNLFKFRNDAAIFLCRTQYQYMVVARRADDTVFRVKECVGTLDDVTAAIMLLWGEIAQRRGFLRVQIADGDAAEQRNDCVAVAVKVNGGRRIRVCRLIGDMDLRIDAERQNFIR